jgi:hypothetical protein
MHWAGFLVMGANTRLPLHTGNQCPIRGLGELFKSLNLHDKLETAIKWCQEEGAESVEDLKDDKYAEELAEALQLPRIKANKLVKAIKGVD